jgi:hypothetical protein
VNHLLQLAVGADRGAAVRADLPIPGRRLTARPCGARVHMCGIRRSMPDDTAVGGRAHGCPATARSVAGHTSPIKH